MSKSVTIYNGTFRKLNGQKRTMSFIRRADLPSNMVNEATISTLEAKTHNEVVFDTEARAFRQFNWKTVERIGWRFMRSFRVKNFHFLLDISSKICYTVYGSTIKTLLTLV